MDGVAIDKYCWQFAYFVHGPHEPYGEISRFINLFIDIFIDSFVCVCVCEEGAGVHTGSST